jgi:hypothetical protein
MQMTLAFLLSNPEHWRERAEDIRVAAVAMNDAETKARMLKIANGYEMLGPAIRRADAHPEPCAQMSLLSPADIRGWSFADCFPKIGIKPRCFSALLLDQGNSQARESSARWVPSIRP